MMEHDFFDMYLEEMRSITPLERDEMVSVLEGTARGDAGARSRLVEGCLGEVLEMVREYAMWSAYSSRPMTTTS